MDMASPGDHPILRPSVWYQQQQTCLAVTLILLSWLPKVLEERPYVLVYSMESIRTYPRFLGLIRTLIISRILFKVPLFNYPSNEPDIWLTELHSWYWVTKDMFGYEVKIMVDDGRIDDCQPTKKNIVSICSNFSRVARLDNMSLIE